MLEKPQQDSSKDPLDTAKGLVRQADWNLVQQEGQELAQIRNTEIPPEIQEKLKTIGAKANENGEFPLGSVTWQDYFDFSRAVWSLVPDEELKALQEKRSSPQQFVFDVGETTDITPETPIKSNPLGHQTTIWRFKIHASESRKTPDTLQFSLTLNSQSKLGKTMIREVFQKVTKAGLPLLDTSWEWESES